MPISYLLEDGQLLTCVYSKFKVQVIIWVSQVNKGDKKKEAPQELSAVQKAPSFLWANCLGHRRNVEIVGGHIDHPDIPYRGQLTAGAVKRMKTNFINTSLKVRANQIAFLHENLDKTIKQVKHELLQIAPHDKETYITYKNKVYDLLNEWLKDETWSRQASPGGEG